MHRTVVINVVGLTSKLLHHMPRLKTFAESGQSAVIGHVTPAVTCSVQATYLTGKSPGEHGIVANGWYDRNDCEIKFWKQADQLVQRPRIWDIARRRDPSFTCANLFWWHAMYSSADVTVTPRPMYPADGRKLPDIWTNPPELRDQLQQQFGPFPLFKFWGPAAGIESTQWIARAATEIAERFAPTLQLIYLPHLDYDLQRFGPDSAQARKAAAAVDVELGRVLDQASARGTRVLFLSEYGIEPVSHPIHLNRRLREAGLLAVRTELGREMLDAGASKAFAVADHQAAHVYVDATQDLDRVERIVRETPGVAELHRGDDLRRAGIDHPRAGEIVAIAAPEAWFTYYYWLDDRAAPDYARTVDIHRKPGYDPAELLLDPHKSAVGARIGWKLLLKKLGMRTLLDVIPLDATLIKGSHGRAPATADDGPMAISGQRGLMSGPRIAATEVCGLILQHLFD